jgi:hypothetical protein
MAESDFTIVTMNQDVYPYTAGDVVGLTKEQLEQLDTTAKRRGIEKPYTKGDNRLDRSKTVTPTGDSEAELERARQVPIEVQPNEGIDGSVPESNADVDQASAEPRAQDDKNAELDAKKMREQDAADAKKKANESKPSGK